MQSDGALAYLILCAEPGMQMMCVTYGTNGMQPGRDRAFRGRYSRVGEEQVILDPCLASRE